MDEEIKFEEAMRRLEEIVEKIESEDMSLDESLAMFEEGIKLSRLCSRILQQAELKIEELVRQDDGNLITVPFDSNRKE